MCLGWVWRLVVSYPGGLWCIVPGRSVQSFRVATDLENLEVREFASTWKNQGISSQNQWPPWACVQSVLTYGTDQGSLRIRVCPGVSIEAGINYFSVIVIVLKSYDVQFKVMERVIDIRSRVQDEMQFGFREGELQMYIHCWAAGEVPCCGWRSLSRPLTVPREVVWWALRQMDVDGWLKCCKVYVQECENISEGKRSR